MILAHAHQVLRPGSEGAGAPRARTLFVLVIVFGLVYGAAMGTFSGVTGERFFQVVYSALKVPLLLMVTLAVALPSFFVLNTLMGVRDDFGLVLRALLATQAGLTIILASLGPFTLLWYASSAHYEAAILFNALMFTVATVTAQSLLRRHYRPLIALRPVHKKLLRFWLFLYAFVGIQLGWVLRPFIGNPTQPTHFFRSGAWGNAYVEIANLVLDVLKIRGR